MRSYTRASTVLFQSTRPRGARPALVIHNRAPVSVSIHAPTGGATAGHRRLSDPARVSIHAPTGGATSRPMRSTPRRSFQSTRPRGARQVLFVLDRDDRRFQSTRPRGARHDHLPDARRVHRTVSIHAPTGGATHLSRRHVPSTVSFNPRAHGGRDRAAQAPLGLPLRVSIHAPTGGATITLPP
ncbi:hypothetical protein C665_02527 [Thauera aminoaromatica S2]|uniref:Uncharacterized protein n=1 Tax=Thauera aminoaromatica S2 TaxID=1234381 RepID=N6Z0X4_THASP|nr:hypothetical protein C665_02527 [Thauera aminoaromatica S2]